MKHRGFAKLMKSYQCILKYLGLHASNPNSGLCAIGDGLLVSRVEDVNEFGIICSRGAVVET